VSERKVNKKRVCKGKVIYFLINLYESEALIID